MADPKGTVDAKSQVALKKIRAAKGGLQGNFYWAGTADEAGLVVFLTKKDLKGKKTLAAGKALRKEITGAKFCRGLVRAEGKRLFFERAVGTATKLKVKKSFKQNLCTLKGLDYLKRAVVYDAEDSDEEKSQETAEGGELEEVELTETERLALEQEVEEQRELGALNAQLDGFLSASSSAIEAVDAAVDELKRLLGQTPPDEDALREAHRELASLLAQGLATLPEPGERIAEEVALLLQPTVKAASVQLTGLRDDSAKRILEIHDYAEKTEAFERSLRAPELLKELHEHRTAYENYARLVELSRIELGS